MAKSVTAGNAKAKLADLVAGVVHRGEHYLITRRGKAVAALVSVEELEQLESERASGARPRGALALVGAWSMLTDAEIDGMISDIYEARELDKGRPVELPD